MAVALNALGVAYLLLGAYGPAEEAIRRALAVGAAAEMTAFLARLSLARVLLARGALAEAVGEARRALEGVRRGVPEAALARAVLADALRAQGALEDAAAEARAALEEAPVTGAGEPGARPEALTVLAAVELARGLPMQALEAARGALGHAGPLQLSPDVEMQARLVLVEALEALGDHEGARTALASARDRLLAIARWIYDEPLRQSFLEAVPWNARLLALSADWLGGANG
jgi:tetratricopeptide (TPR) repeat protein